MLMYHYCKGVTKFLDIVREAKNKQPEWLYSMLHFSVSHLKKEKSVLHYSLSSAEPFFCLFVAFATRISNERTTLSTT